MLTPYRAVIDTVDIRGLTRVMQMPAIDSAYTLVLGDSVKVFRDVDETGHRYGTIAIGSGMTTFFQPGFRAYDRNGNNISGTALQGRLLMEQRAK